MLEKLKRVLRVLFFVHLGVGFILIVSLAFSAPFVIGVGQFDQFLQKIESFNFKWWVVGVVTAVWSIPIFFVVVHRTARAVGLQMDRLVMVVRRVLEHQTFPIQVDIDNRIPVEFDEPLRIPVALKTKIDINDTIAIEADIPIRTEIPIEADVETKVLGIGRLKVPIRSKIPIDVVVPIRASVRVRAHDVPIDLNEEAVVRLPPIEVPIRTRIETKLDILANLEAAEELIKKIEARVTTSRQ